MQLSKRLKAVTDNVTRGNHVADIGCDHAYVSIYLIQQQIASSVIAMDVNEGPLKIARENIKRYGYWNQIETRRSDGAKELKAKESETLIIAGMGGGLTIKILSDSKEVVQDVKELVLQPQSEIPFVRQYLHEIGFKIVNENMLMDEGKYYVVLRAIKGQESYDKQEYYLYGKLLLENKNQVLKEYLENGYQKHIEIRNKLVENESHRAEKRIKELKEEIGYMMKGLSYYEN